MPVEWIEATVISMIAQQSTLYIIAA